MLSGHGSAWRRRRNSRAARIAVPLAIPMALGLTLGIVLAVSGGNTTTIAQSALGDCATAAASAGASGAAPAASASAPAPAASAAASASAPASAPASAAPCPSAAASGSAPASAPATTAATVAGIPPINPPGRVGLAGSNAVDAAGNAFSFAQTEAEAADSTNCTVTVPDRPLTAQGLATP